MSILTILPQTASAKETNEILAHVGNKVITSYDVKNLDPQTYRKIMSIKNPKDRVKELKKYKDEALDFLINQEIIVIAAEREGIKVTDKEVDRAINEILAHNHIEPSKLNEYLEKEGLSLSKYRIQIRNEILNAKVRAQVLMPKIVVVDSDIHRLADAKSEELQLHDKYNVRILMAQNKKFLEKALAEIKKGMKFEEAVSRYSIDKSASNGGKLGWIDYDLVSKEMQHALTTTPAGTISKPFETKGQWAVFMVDGFKSKYDLDKETIAKLKEEASEEMFNRVFQEWLDSNKATILILKNRGAADEAG